MNVRTGERKDLPAVLELIRELAIYENAGHEVETDTEQMEKDCFGESPVFGFFVAEDTSGKIQGTAIYYYRYSTWKGKRLYLEDIVVTEEQRGKGIGKLLFDATILKAKQENCKGMNWQVLDWNEPAIGFYKKYQADFDEEWINCSLSAEQLRDF